MRGPQHPALTWVLVCMPEMVPWELRWLERPVYGSRESPCPGACPEAWGKLAVIMAPPQTPLPRPALTVSTAIRFCKTKPGQV